MGKYKVGRPAAIIFDLDGTLIDSGLDIAISANFVRVHFGLPELKVEVAKSFVGDGVAKLQERVLGHDLPPGAEAVTEDRHAEAMAVFLDHYGRHLLDNTVLYPGVLDILARYREVPIHLATNKPRAFTDPILDGLHIRAAFDRVVCGDETPARKPDPSHLLACLPAGMTDYSTVAMVGDSPNDVNAAKALGALSVGCTYGLGNPGQVKAARPDFLIDVAGDLARLFPSRAGDLT